VVPACRSLDCVSIFSLTSEDAARVLSVMEGFDAADPYSRALSDTPPRGRRFGIPRRDQLQFFGDREYARLFDQAVERIALVGGPPTEIDFAPFLEAARLLYEGPWVAERYAAIQDFIEQHAGAMHSVTREIIVAGKSPSAAELFNAQYRLKSLSRAAEDIWNRVDVIVTPTSGTIYERASIEAAPIQLNANLGYYTNFMNLLDLAGVAVSRRLSRGWITLRRDPGGPQSHGLRAARSGWRDAPCAGHSSRRAASRQWPASRRGAPARSSRSPYAAHIWTACR
jgi:allophanate hydrolase